MTLVEAQQHLDDWLAADRAVSTGQNYSIGGRSLTRADADTILNRITYWNRVVNSLTAAENGVQNNPGRATWT